MSASNNPAVDFEEVGGRPYIEAYLNEPTFSIGDEVFLLENGTRDGPYEIATTPSGGKCKLSLKGDPNTLVRGGAEFALSDLEEA